MSGGAGSGAGKAASDAARDAARDEALLDEAFGRVMTLLADGRDADPAAILPDRPDLHAQIREMTALAAKAVTRRPAPRPTFAGYEIVREIGRGGMGQVHLARHEKLGRTVALKVLPRRVASGRARDRFLREARAVARLQHPLIVPVYDLGDEDGQPYFTMAFVEGGTLAAAIASVRGREPASLTSEDFARGVGLASVPERWQGGWWRAAAQTAADIADALSYAHGAGVVHRDVKPSNVMLRRDGFALLFDFGLAAVEDEATLTLTQGFVGTPHYASPEQASGATDSLDARTDVFSLGAALYEALTLRLPFPGPTTHEVLRRIQTWEPEAPDRVSPQIPKDLVTVLLAALEKDREKRYASAAAFAEDLRAVLAGRKVRAKRAGLIERGLRSVRRGRALTELLVEQQARNEELRSAVLRAEANERLAKEREDAMRAALARAETERAKADRIRKFLESMLASADPDRDGRDVRVADLLDRATTDAEKSFADQPEILASVLYTIGTCRLSLGESLVAREIFRRAVAASIRASGERDPMSIELTSAVGVASGHAGDIEDALANLGRAVELSIEVLGPDEPNTIERQVSYAEALSRSARHEEAVKILRDTYVRATRVLGEDAVGTQLCGNNLAIALKNAGGSLAEAEVALRRCLASRIRTLGPDHAFVTRTLANLGSLLANMPDRAAEAEEVLRRSLAALQAAMGEKHIGTLAVEHNLGNLLSEQGRFEEALPFLRSTAERIAELVVPTDLRIAQIRGGLARALHRVGRLDEAIVAASGAVDVVRLAGTPPGGGSSVDLLSSLLREAGRTAEADALLAEFRTGRAS